jgi:hypothetical protein
MVHAVGSWVEFRAPYEMYQRNGQSWTVLARVRGIVIARRGDYFHDVYPIKMPRPFTSIHGDFVRVLQRDILDPCIPTDPDEIREGNEIRARFGLPTP